MNNRFKYPWDLFHIYILERGGRWRLEKGEAPLQKNPAVCHI